MGSLLQGTNIYRGSSIEQPNFIWTCPPILSTRYLTRRIKEPTALPTQRRTKSKLRPSNPRKPRRNHRARIGIVQSALQDPVPDVGKRGCNAGNEGKGKETEWAGTYRWLRRRPGSRGGAEAGGRRRRLGLLSRTVCNSF